MVRVKKIEIIIYLPDDASILEVLDKTEAFKEALYSEMSTGKMPRLVDTVYTNFGIPIEKYYYSKFRVTTIGETE